MTKLIKNQKEIEGIRISCRHLIQIFIIVVVVLLPCYFAKAEEIELFNGNNPNDTKCQIYDYKDKKISCVYKNGDEYKYFWGKPSEASYTKIDSSHVGENSGTAAFSVIKDDSCSVFLGDVEYGPYSCSGKEDYAGDVKHQTNYGANNKLIMQRVFMDNRQYKLYINNTEVDGSFDYIFEPIIISPEESQYGYVVEPVPGETSRFYYFNGKKVEDCNAFRSSYALGANGLQIYTCYVDKNSYVIKTSNGESFSSIWEADGLIVSKDGLHYSFNYFPEGGKINSILDGRNKSLPIGNYATFLADNTVASRGGAYSIYIGNKKITWLGRQAESFLVSNDGKHFAYYSQGVKTKNDKSLDYLMQTMAVLDNKKISKGYSEVTNMVLSPNGQRLAFIGVINGSKPTKYVVIDFKEFIQVSDYKQEISKIVFSPDSSHHAFWTNEAKTGKSTLYLDGKNIKTLGKIYDHSFSKNGLYLLVVAQSGSDVKLYKFSLYKEEEIIVMGGKNLQLMLDYNEAVKNTDSLREWMDKFTTPLTINDKKIKQNEIYAINNFMVYGTLSTAELTIEQRSELVKKFKDKNKRVPKSVKDWAEVLKIKK